MEQTNSCDSDSGRGPTGGGQCQCKETKEKNHRDRNISFSMLKCSQFPGGYFLADEQYPSYSNVY